MSESFVFQEDANIKFGGNSFQNVPIILQFDDTPLIEVIQKTPVNCTTSLPIFHEDGTYLGKVVGSRFHPTPCGKKAGVSLRHGVDLLVVQKNKKSMFEIKRIGAAAIAINAELYTNTGHLIRVTKDEFREMLNPSGEN